MNRATQVPSGLSNILMIAPILSFGIFAALPGDLRAEAPDPGPRSIMCRGKAVGVTGKPLARVEVTAYEMLSDGIAGNIELQVIGLAVTDGSGTFHFETDSRPGKGRPLGGYIVAVRPGWALGWAPWDLREDLQVRVELGEPKVLGGTIVDEAGKPVEGANIRANLTRVQTTAGGTEKKGWLPGIAPLDVLGTRTDNQGRFQFDGLPADSGVDLLITAPGKAVTYTFSFEGEGKPRFLAGQKDIEVVLPAEGRIEGKIRDVATGKGVPGTRLGIGAAFSPAFYYRFACTSAGDGSFSVRGLPSGNYSIHGPDLPPHSVTVQSGQTAQITISSGTQALYGRVLFKDGRPAVIQPPPWPGARTSLHLWRGDDLLGPFIGEVDEDGYFEVRLSYDQLQWLQSGQAWLFVNIPMEEVGQVRRVAAFPPASLATTRDQAGVITVNRPAGEAASLMGEPLPPLDDLGLDADRAGATDKMVLVCFFDMNQRPSRRCLSHLAEQAGRLSAKSIAIVGIQTSDVDDHVFEEWMRQNNIPFPVGRIDNDVDYVKASWGVRSLPWLILTDKRHTVHAEGFAIEELGDKMKQVVTEQ